MKTENNVIDMILMFRRELVEISESELCFERLEFLKYRWNSFLQRRVPHLQQIPVVIGVSFKAPNLEEKIDEYLLDIHQLDMEIRKVLWNVTTFGVKNSEEKEKENSGNKSFRILLYKTILFIYRLLTETTENPESIIDKFPTLKTIISTAICQV